MRERGSKKKNVEEKKKKMMCLIMYLFLHIVTRNQKIAALVDNVCS